MVVRRNAHRGGTPGVNWYGTWIDRHRRTKVSRMQAAPVQRQMTYRENPARREQETFRDMRHMARAVQRCTFDQAVSRVREFFRNHSIAALEGRSLEHFLRLFATKSVEKLMFRCGVLHEALENEMDRIHLATLMLKNQLADLGDRIRVSRAADIFTQRDGIKARLAHAA